MKQSGELFQTADWKTEKHVPAIECADEVKAGKPFPVNVTLGKEVAHPNTTEHHIRWISVYFHPDGEKLIHHIGHFESAAHGESAEGADKSSIYTQHEVSLSMKTGKPGVIYATALCNIHGLWQSAKKSRRRRKGSWELSRSISPGEVVAEGRSMVRNSRRRGGHAVFGVGDCPSCVGKFGNHSKYESGGG